MSDGVLNFPVLMATPSTPTAGRIKIYIDGITNKPKYLDDSGTVNGFESVYGSNFQFTQDQFEDTNTTTTYKTYASIAYPVGVAVAGRKYEISFTATTRYSTAGRNHISRIALDGSTLEEEVSIEHKDTGADIRFPISYNYIIDGSQLSVGGGFIDFDFKSQLAGDTARVYSCTLTFKRVF